MKKLIFIGLCLACSCQSYKEEDRFRYRDDLRSVRKAVQNEVKEEIEFPSVVLPEEKVQLSEEAPVAQPDEQESQESKGYWFW